MKPERYNKMNCGLTFNDASLQLGFFESLVTQIIFAYTLSDIRSSNCVKNLQLLQINFSHSTKRRLVSKKSKFTISDNVNIKKD